MTFISYAQNYEDVMLRRALKDVEKGFYIDVGANDPITDSVTKAFYDAGWSGINIEPVNEWFEKLQQDRPNDINLQLAVGARKGKVNFYEVVGTGLSTMDESIANRHAQDSGYELKRHKIPTVRLTTICEQYPHSDIHFLKIDVEGAELSVLQGLDLKKIRPWIILVESTLPNLQIENYDIWEHTLTERGYHYVYFDGLNRFYVADEHGELDNAFKLPPNYFDFFKRASEDWLECHAEWLKNEWDASKLNFNQIEESVKQAESNLQEIKQQRQQLEIQSQALQAEVAQRDEKLHEKETKHQELLLLMLEKETRIQEAVITLTENKQEIDKLQASLADVQEQRQVFEATSQEMRQQRQQLEIQSQTLQAEVAQRDEKLHEKETKHQELLLLMLEKETRIQEVGVTLTENKQEIEKLQASLADVEEQRQVFERTLQETRQQCQQLGVQLCEKEKSVNCLNKELEGVSVKIDELHQSNHHWWLESERAVKELEAASVKIDELHQSNHHWWLESERAVKELEAASVKIDELHQSNHHWWLESERSIKELRTIYNSKFWTITWPLRKLMQLFKWVVAVPYRFTLFIISLPKRSIRWFIIKAMAFALKRPALKLWSVNWLRQYPRLDRRLRQLAKVRNLVAGQPDTTPIPTPAHFDSVVTEPASGSEGSNCGVYLPHLTPSAHRIYRELKAAIEERQKERN